MEQPEELIKLMLVGNQAVGKTSLLSKYAKDQFVFDMIGTTGVDFQKKYFSHKGVTYKINVFDSAGHERFRHITQGYFKNADGLVLVYDITDSKSFTDIRDWIEQIKRQRGEFDKIVISGNKCDLEDFRVVDKEKTTELSKEFGFNCLETSAKDGINVESLFTSLILKIIEDKKKKPVIDTEKENMTTKPTENPVIIEKKKKKFNCCVVN